MIYVEIYLIIGCLMMPYFSLQYLREFDKTPIGIALRQNKKFKTILKLLAVALVVCLITLTLWPIFLVDLIRAKIKTKKETKTK